MWACYIGRGLTKGFMALLLWMWVAFCNWKSLRPSTECMLHACSIRQLLMVIILNYVSSSSLLSVGPTVANACGFIRKVAQKLNRWMYGCKGGERGNRVARVSHHTDLSDDWDWVYASLDFVCALLKRVPFHEAPQCHVLPVVRTYEPSLVAITDSAKVPTCLFDFECTPVTDLRGEH